MMDTRRSEMISSNTQDQSILEFQTQVELLKEEQERKINQLRESFLEEIDELKGQIQALNSEKEQQKVTHEKALTEMVEKLAAQLKHLEHNHKDRMSKVFEKHRELEQRLQAMQQNYEEKLCEQKEKYSLTIMEMKQAYDDMLQDVRNLETLAQRMRDDLRTCSKYVQYPQQLKKNCIKLQLHKPVRFVGNSSNVQGNTRKKEHLQGTVDCQEQRQATEARNQQAECSINLKLEADVDEMNTQSKEIIEDLKQKLQIQSQELCTERKKVRNLEILAQRLKDDLYTCSNYVNYPHLLKENFIKLQLFKPVRTMENLVQRIKADTQTCANVLECSHLLRENVVKLQLHKPRKAKAEEVIIKKHEIIEDLKQKLKKQERELCSERKRIKNLNALVKKMKDDIQTCSGYIRYPQLLRDNFIKLQLHKPERFNVKAGVLQDHPWSKKYLRMVDPQEQHQTMKTKNQQADCAKNLKVTVGVNAADLQDHIRKEDLQGLLESEEESQAMDTKYEQAGCSINLKQAEMPQRAKTSEDMRNLMTKKTMYGLKQRLKMKEKELCTERQRVREIKTLMERMKSDIRTCSSFIKEPKMLKDNFIKLHKCYVQEADVKAEGMQEDTRKKSQTEALNHKQAKIQQYRTKTKLAKNTVPDVNVGSSWKIQRPKPDVSPLRAMNVWDVQAVQNAHQ